MLVELLFAFDVGTTVITYGEMVASLDFKCHAGATTGSHSLIDNNF